MARSSHPPRGVRVSLCSVHCWNPDPSAASIRSKCRTERPWRVQPVPAATVFQTDSLLINPKCYPRRETSLISPETQYKVTNHHDKTPRVCLPFPGAAHSLSNHVPTQITLRSFRCSLPNPEEPKDSAFTCQIHCLSFFLLPTSSISNP